MFSYCRTTRPEFASTNTAIEALWAQHPLGETQLVLHEREFRRPTYLLTRGDFLKPADQMTAGVPSVLNPLANSEVPERLRMAEWIGDRRSPTTARAIVNRIWQEYFEPDLFRRLKTWELRANIRRIRSCSTGRPNPPTWQKHLRATIADENPAIRRQASHVSKELYRTRSCQSSAGTRTTVPADRRNCS
ncbi:MAG: DUF1553 domain-containing protein [Planctomycetaceae bacterium]